MVTVAGSGILYLSGQFYLRGKYESVPVRFSRRPEKKCTCTPYQAQRYRNRILGPILDRIVLQIEVPRLEIRDLKSGGRETSADIKTRVIQAHGLQQDRFHNDGIAYNAKMRGRQIKAFCRLKSESQELLHRVFQALNLTMRAHDRVLKVARTIADLAGSDQIEPLHLAEAVQYRCFDRPLYYQ